MGDLVFCTDSQRIIANGTVLPRETADWVQPKR